MIRPKALRWALKPFAWALSHLLYQVGSMFYRIMWSRWFDNQYEKSEIDWVAKAIYYGYSKCMVASLIVQGWTLNKTPWWYNFDSKKEEE